MNNRFLVVFAAGFLFLSSKLSPAANHYIYSGATGSGSGSSWANAYTDIPATLIRGDIYYIAGGSYGSHTFNSLSGTSYVYLKKANPTDNGTDVGWQTAYATTPAVFSSGGSVFIIHMSYLSIEGVTGSGMNGYGIVLQTTGTAQGSGATVYSYQSAPNYLVLSHLECACPDPNGNCSNFNIDCHVWPGATGELIQNCYIHGGLVGVLFTGSNQTLDHCYLRSFGHQQHSEVIDAANVVNLTIRYNVLEDLLDPSTTYIEPQVNGGSTPTGIYIYGNVFRAVSAGEGSENPSVLSSTSGELVQNVFIYNNTFYGLHGCSPTVGMADTGVRGANTSSTITVQNNIWQNCAYNPGFQAVQVQDHNLLNTGGASFMNASAGDFHLSKNTTSGVNLGAPYNIDPDGNTRTTWSLGAYEYANPVQAPTVSTINYNSTGLFTNLPGTTIQALVGIMGNLSASATDPAGLPLTWQWILSVNGSTGTVYQSGTGQVSSISYTNTPQLEGQTNIWTLIVGNGSATTQSSYTNLPPLPIKSAVTTP